MQLRESTSVSSSFGTWHVWFASACFLLAGITASYSQPLTVSTVAGYPGQGSADGTGNNARFSNPSGVAVDSSGNVYVADTANHTIRRITPAGEVSTLAGLAGVSGSDDGSGAAARFNQPRGVTVDTADNVYVADTGNHTVRLITSAGAVSTLAGLAGASGSDDGTGSAARFNHPEGVAVDAAGDVYVADTWNHTVRQVTSAGAVSTLAGSAGNYGTADGTGSAARFYQPQGIAADNAGALYVADTGNHTIRKITSGGTVSTLAGSAGNYGSSDGLGTAALFYGPAGISADGLGNLYVADYFNQTLRKVTPAGAVSTLAGFVGSYGSQDGTNDGVRFRGPAGVAARGTNDVALYVADTANGTIRQLTTSGADWVSSTWAGSASTGSADGPSAAARFYWPAAAAMDGGGNAYVADTQNGTIRKVSGGGDVTTLAGLAGSYGSADGMGSDARFSGPQGVAVDNAGTVYVADTANATIRKITAGGDVSTWAGLPGETGILDGTGSNARFSQPQGLAVDNGGTLFVTDTWNHTIRKITPAGVVSTLAGVPGSPGCIDSTGDQYGTNAARFHCPAAVAVDSAGNVYVADSLNHTIRRVTAAGVVSTLAGLPGVWGSNDGTNTNARFYRPAGIVVDVATNIYVLDSGNHTIRKLTADGTNWVVSTVAGVPAASGSSDGAGDNAQFNYPTGLGIDSNGALVVADTANNTLRQASLVTTGPPVILTQPQDLTLVQGANAAFAVLAGGATPFFYQWIGHGTNIPGATNATYLHANVQPSDAGQYSVVVSNAAGMTNSRDATLTVLVPPAITTQPAGQTITQGATVTLTAAASGTAPLFFQWRFNGGSIAGGTGTSYTISDTQPADSGSYSVVVTNQGGSAVSSNAVLHVIAPPTIAIQPLRQTANPGNVVIFSVAANGTAPLSYQWQWYGTNLSGATGSSLMLTGVTTNQNGPYTVLVTNEYGSVASHAAALMVNPTFQAAGLEPLWMLAPGSRPYLTVNSLPYERGMAYNPAAGHLLVVSRLAPSIYVLDAATGADLNQLSVSGISGDAYSLLMTGVAEDGAIYAGNLTTASSTTPLTLYRWANDSAAATPTVAYTGNPTTGNSQRYGDTIDVRGAGAGTQIIIGSRSSTNAVLFTTTDGLTFTPRSIVVADAPNSSFGLGIAFGEGDSFWGKTTAAALRQVGYNFAAGTGTTAHSYADPQFPNSVGPIGVSTQYNLLGAINVGSSNNHLRLYDISPALTNGAPLLIATSPFATDNDNSTTGTGAVDFGPGAVYALCANNGLLAMQIVPPPQAGRFEEVGLLAGGAVHLLMSGTPGASYSLEYTTNWAGWTPLDTLSGTNGYFQYTDSGAAGGSQRFYRLRLTE